MFNIWGGGTYLEVDTTDWELGGESQQTPWLSSGKCAKKMKEKSEFMLNPFIKTNSPIYSSPLIFAKGRPPCFVVVRIFSWKKFSLWRAEVWQKWNMDLLLHLPPTKTFDCVTMFVWVGTGIWTDWVIGWEVGQTLSKQRLRHLSKASLALSKLPTLCQKLPILSHKMRTLRDLILAGQL